MLRHLQIKKIMGIKKKGLVPLSERQEDLLNNSLEYSNQQCELQLQRELDAAHRFIDQGGDGQDDPYTLYCVSDAILGNEAVAEAADALFDFKAWLGNVVNFDGLGAVGKRFTGIESSRSGRSLRKDLGNNGSPACYMVFAYLLRRIGWRAIGNISKPSFTLNSTTII
jgi:hypothetical protein